MNGWISIHRKITKHWIWDDPKKLKWWLDLLFLANYHDSKVNIGNRIIECKSGQLVYSLETLARRWMVTKKTVRRFLMLCQSDSMLVIERVQFSTRITICNYLSYQNQVNDLSPISPQLVPDLSPIGTPIQEYNKEDKENKDNKKVKRRGKYNFPIPAPTIDEFCSFFKENGYDVEKAKGAWHTYDANEWNDSNDKPIENWKRQAKFVWFKPENKAPIDFTKRVMA